MSHSESVQDPLKPLDKVMNSDPRLAGSLAALQQQHANLYQIQLHSDVPLHVRQLFETAKNVSLYSWFVYRFHQVAELMAYTTLERALRERFAQAGGIKVDDVQKTLAPLLKAAAQNGWLKAERFSDAKHLARLQLEQERTIQSIHKAQFSKEPVEIPEVPDAEVLARAAQLNYVDRLAAGMPYFRNHLAHGGPLLQPGSAETLRIVGEAINQLFGGA